MGNGTLVQRVCHTGYEVKMVMFGWLPEHTLVTSTPLMCTHERNEPFSVLCLGFWISGRYSYDSAKQTYIEWEVQPKT